MKRLCTAAVAAGWLLFGAASAGAAGPIPWVGPYAGLNIGYSWSAWSASSNQLVFNFESTTASPKVDGVIGGMQFGYNWRFASPWVWGFEGDIQLSNEKASETWTDPGLPAIVPPPLLLLDFVPRPGGPAVLSHDWKFPWFATLRLRGGFLISENWLVFATGGLAFGESKYTFTFSQPGAAANAPPTATSYSLTHDTTRAGVALGVGTEFKIDSQWSIKAEYLYIDLGKVSIDTLDIDGLPFHVEYRIRDNIARIGLNFAFSP